jgi:hypothetical protein
MLAGSKRMGCIATKREKEIAQKLEKVRKASTNRSKFGILIPPHPSVTVAKAQRMLSSYRR